MKLRHLIISLLVGVISLATFSLSFSIAWFASSTNLYVDSINMEMKTDRNLRIATTDQIEDIEHYDVNELTYDDLIKTKLFSPVSSMFKDSWISEKSDIPHFYNYENTLTNNGVPYLKEVKNTFGDSNSFNNYYSQDLYLICDDDVYVTLDVEKTFVRPNTEYNWRVANDVVAQGRKDFLGYTVEEVNELLNNLIRSIRISFLTKTDDYYQYVIFDPYKSGDTLLGGRLDVEKDRYYDSYSRSGGQRYETIYGEFSGDRYSEDNYGDRNDNDVYPNTDKYSSFTAISKEGVKPFDCKKAIENGLNIKEEGALSSDEIADETIGLKIPVYRNKPAKFVLSIYLEGWDLDCINTVMGANFLSEIQFKILREM